MFFQGLNLNNGIAGDGARAEKWTQDLNSTITR